MHHCVTTCNTQYKIGKVKQCRLGPGGIPFAVLHDGKTLRYPDPNTKVGDTIKVCTTLGYARMLLTRWNSVDGSRC